MKIYRSIEFSKLIFLLDEDRQFLWDDYQAERDQQTDSTLHFNWWMNSAFEKKRRELIAYIILNSQESFFSKSLEFNAMSGGRFNPDRSFGVLYCATNPVAASLEVLYHKFIDLLPVHKGFRRNQDKIHSGLNMKIPKELEVLIISFEIELESGTGIVQINDSESNLKDVCSKIGFNRYTSQNFCREFIFGNDYEISRHLGTYVHSKNHHGFFVPSARLGFEIQDNLKMRNVVLFEKHLEKFKPTFTGNFVEHRCRVDLDGYDILGPDVTIEATGANTKKSSFKLQPIPPKKGEHTQIISYKPNISASHSRPRTVHVQKYFVPTSKAETND